MKENQTNEGIDSQQEEKAAEDQLPEVSEEQTAEAEAESSEEPQLGKREDEEMNKLKEELSASKDKYLRLYSEFENFRRRTAKEKLEMTVTANEQLIKSLIPVIDDFERAEKSFKDLKDSNVEGFFLIQSKFKKVLESFSVKAMEVDRGAEFNADLHEAITQIPAPAPDLKGKVVDVVEKGYMINDKVIRFAKVVVGS